MERRLPRCTAERLGLMRRSRTERCRYCGRPRGWPCSDCAAALKALRMSRLDPEPRAVTTAPVSASDVTAFVEGLEIVPTVPRFGYMRQR